MVFVTSEAAPYSKTGGLGDVCGSLPIALAARGHRVMVVSPRYMDGGLSDQKFANAVDTERPTKIHCFGGVQEVGLFHEYRAGVDWVRRSIYIYRVICIDNRVKCPFSFNCGIVESYIYLFCYIFSYLGLCRPPLIPPTWNSIWRWFWCVW